MNMRATLQLPLARRSIEDRIERLLALLDEIDGDADFEPAGDLEPSLGWPLHGPSALQRDCHDGNTTGGDVHHTRRPVHDDREMDDCDDEDSYDREAVNEDGVEA